MRWIVRTACIVLGSATPVVAQQPGETGWTPVLQLRALQATPQGTAANLSSDWKLVKEGAPLGLSIWTGSNLCDVGIAHGAEASPESAQRNVWSATGEYLGEQSGRQQIRIVSRFLRLSGRDTSAATTQTLSLREGDNVTLDALTEATEAGCKVHALTIDARLIMQATDPALARARYAADLWLVHTAPDGKEQREHLVMNVDGSNVMPFMFNRLAFPIPQVDPRQGDAEAVIQLTGALRARPRTDGLIDLDVETNRFLFGLENPNAPLRSSPTTVRKTLTLKEGETTAIDFPPPENGFAAIALDGYGKTYKLRVQPGKVVRSQGGNAVEVKEGKLWLYTFKFFQGHKTQLLVTLRKLG